MSRPIDLTRRVFGRLTVLRRVPTPAGSKDKQARWECRCECGDVRSYRGHSLRCGNTTQCRDCANVTARAAIPRQTLVTLARRFSRPEHPKRCPACGTEFRGTARQVYCKRACRPSMRRE